MNCCFRPIAPDKGANKKCKKICIYQAQSPSLHCWPSHSRPVPSAHWYKLGSEPPNVEQSELRTSREPRNGVKEPKQSSDAEQPDLSSETPRHYEDFMTLGWMGGGSSNLRNISSHSTNLKEELGWKTRVQASSMAAHVWNFFWKLKSSGLKPRPLEWLKACIFPSESSEIDVTWFSNKKLVEIVYVCFIQIILRISYKSYTVEFCSGTLPQMCLKNKIKHKQFKFQQLLT